MRLAVYCDYSYRVVDRALSAELPFGLFLRELAKHCERLIVTGRLEDVPEPFPYPMGDVGYVPLPNYRSGAHMFDVLSTIPTGVRRFWRLLDEVDVVWILGPNPPQVFAFALLAIVRRRRLVLGVRQNLPELIRHRHPRRPLVKLAASLLDRGFRLLARLAPTAVVGSDLARRYRHARATHTMYVSLLSDGDIVAAGNGARVYDGGELRMLSVGRLDAEKNPLLLADVLARALGADDRWRLDVCGDGTEASALAAALERLGIADRAALHGYVPIDAGLWEFYRRSHVLLHVSHTEGVPQVLLEAFAARLPVVATAVGGVAELVSGCGLLIPPDDADAAVEALGRLATDAQLRESIVEGAIGLAGAHTLQAECARLATFLAGDGQWRTGAAARSTNS